MEIRKRKVIKSREQIEAEKNNPPEHGNYRHTMSALEFFNRFCAEVYTPNRILKNEAGVTVVFWKDGSITVVKPAEGIIPNEYEAFTAALAKKIFGNNSALKKVIQRNTVLQKPKRKKKKDEPECVFSGSEDETLPCENCHGTPNYSCPAAHFPGDEGVEEPNEADRD